MDFNELINRRHSVRKYTSQPVPSQMLEEILQAGRLAPTAHNKQPQKLFVLQKPCDMDKLKSASNTYNAPLAIIVCADKQKSWKRPYDGKMSADIDGSIVATFMI